MKKHTIRMRDEDYGLACRAAKMQGLSFSSFMVRAGLRDISRHAPKKALKEVVRELVSEYLEERVPVRVSANGGENNGGAG